MGIITELSPQKKRKDRYNLYLDGEFLCGINLEAIVKNHLKAGLEIDGEQIKRAVFESECTDAFNRGADYLGRGRRTEKELFDYLLAKGFDPEVAEFAAEKLKSYRYVDDGEYLKAYFSYGVSGKGKLKIRQELLRRGIAESSVAESLSEFEEDSEEALALAVKFMRGREFDLKSKAALWRHLAGKGYGSDTIRSAAGRLFTGADED